MNRFVTSSIRVALVLVLTISTAHAQDRASGVRVTEAQGTPGEGVEIRITCGGSLSSGSSPLFIVDGVQLSRDGATPSPLSSLTNDDIVSIEILRNPDAAIYGPQAANGVVIITTNRDRLAAGDAEAFGVRSLYPNPARGPMTLTYDLPESVEIGLEIYDLLGRLVSRTDAGTVAAGAGLHVEISTTALSSGTYVYRLIAGAESATGRFTVVR